MIILTGITYTVIVISTFNNLNYYFHLLKIIVIINHHIFPSVTYAFVYINNHMSASVMCVFGYVSHLSNTIR